MIAGRAVLIIGLAMPVTVRGARAQDAETLYGAGAYRLAADSFAARAAREPGVPGYWYNLGNALYHIGENAGARAAWLRAARLSPRSATVRQALSLVPAPDAISAQATAVSIVTPGEALLVAAGLWVLGWVLVMARRRAWHVLTVLVVALAVAGLGWSRARAYQRPIALVRHANTALRAAPFASANARRALNESMTVEVLRTYAGWAMVVRGNDRGWVQRTEIEPLAPIRDHRGQGE